MVSEDDLAPGYQCFDYPGCINCHPLERQRDSPHYPAPAPYPVLANSNHPSSLTDSPPTSSCVLPRVLLSVLSHSGRRHHHCLRATQTPLAALCHLAKHSIQFLNS